MTRKEIKRERERENERKKDVDELIRSLPFPLGTVKLLRAPPLPPTMQIEFFPLFSFWRSFIKLRRGRDKADAANEIPA